MLCATRCCSSSYVAWYCALSSRLRIYFSRCEAMAVCVCVLCMSVCACLRVPMCTSHRWAYVCIWIWQKSGIAIFLWGQKYCRVRDRLYAHILSHKLTHIQPSTLSHTRTHTHNGERRRTRTRAPPHTLSSVWKWQLPTQNKRTSLVSYASTLTEPNVLRCRAVDTENYE